MTDHRTVDSTEFCPPATFIGMAAGSFAALALEIVLLRVFSFRIWHHFAFMVISIALLGIAFAGVLLQRRPALAVPASRRAATYAALLGIAGPLAVALTARVPFDPREIATDPAQWLWLAVFYAVLVVPFTLSGLLVLVLLRGHAARAARLYAADLAGAGVGALFVAPALGLLGAPGVALAAGAAAFVAAGCLAHAEGAAKRGAAFGAAALCLALLPWSGTVISIPPGPGKLLGHFLLDPVRFPAARLTETHWNALSRVDVVENSARMDWTENPAHRVRRPPETQIVIDGDAAAPVVNWSGRLEDLDFLDQMLSSAAAQAFHPRRALIIGAGGGVDVLSAVHHGVAQIDAVEVNPAVAAIVRGTLAKTSGGLFQRPGVTLHVAEGRAFVRSSSETYDMLQLSLIDTWAAAASGAYSLSESYLYTVEAFRDYLRHLTPGGVLTVTRWEWSPPRELIRVCAVARAALEAEGARDPAAHIVVLGSGNLGSVMVRRTPFGPQELASLRRVADERSLLLAFQPGVSGGGPFETLLRSSDTGPFLASYPYDIAPVYDDNPFFFQFGRWRDAGLFGAGWKEKQLLLSGRLVLYAVLAQAVLFAVLLLVVPLALGRASFGSASAGDVRRAAGYFFAVGLSFMLLEISLMQRFTLFLGSPLLAISVVLATLLLAAGAGSALAPRLAGRGRPAPLFVALAVVAAVGAFGLPRVFDAALAWPEAGRIALSVLLLAPIGLLLGVPLPAGLARLEAAGARDLFGVAWAANGAASVIGPVLGAMLAIDIGFTMVTLIGAGGYLAALSIFGGWWNR